MRLVKLASGTGLLPRKSCTFHVTGFSVSAITVSVISTSPAVIVGTIVKVRSASSVEPTVNEFLSSAISNVIF